MKMQFLTKKRIIIIILSFIICSLSFFVVYQKCNYMVKSVSPLDANILNQSATETEPIFPANLYVKTTFGSENLKVTWEEIESKRVDNKVIKSYKPVLPKKYKLKKNVELPIITATFELSTTTVSALENIDCTINDTPNKEVIITPSYGRKLELQFYDEEASNWVTKKEFNLGNETETNLNLDFPDEWKNYQNSKWRINLPETTSATAYTSEEFALNLKPLTMKVSGFSKNQSYPENYNASFEIKVENGFNKKISLEYLNPSTKKWEVKETFAAGDKESKINITFPKNWSENSNSTWRLTAPKTIQSSGYQSGNINLSVMKTSISSLPKQVTGFVGKSASFSVKVNVALGRTIELQKNSNGIWTTMSKITTGKNIQENTKIDFPSGWDKESSSKWRLYLPKSNYGEEYTSASFTLVALEETIVTNLKTDLTAKASETLKTSFTINHARGRNIYLEYWNGSKKTWERKATVVAPKGESSTVDIYFPKDWAKASKMKWRINIPATDKLSAYSKELNVTATPTYQVPSKYLQITDNIHFSGGGYELTKGTMGLKVKKVQEKLNIENERAIVDDEFINAVKTFQKSKGLKADGIVGLNTWKAMGFSENDWYYLGTFVTPKKTTLTSTREDYIETMIATAKTYLKTEYVIGASGKPNTGVDCSGLVLQGFYAAGLNPLPVSVVRHSKKGHEYESYYLWTHNKLKRVSYEERQRGDLIFYKNEEHRLNHVAIYLGNDEVIEAWPPEVSINPIVNEEHPYVLGVIRPFP